MGDGNPAVQAGDEIGIHKRFTTRLAVTPELVIQIGALQGPFLAGWGIELCDMVHRSSTS